MTIMLGEYKIKPPKFRGVGDEVVCVGSGVSQSHRGRDFYLSLEVEFNTKPFRRWENA